MSYSKICKNCGFNRNKGSNCDCISCGRPLEVIKEPSLDSELDSIFDTVLETMIESIVDAATEPTVNFSRQTPNVSSGDNIGEDAVCDLIDRVTNATVFVVSLNLQSGSTGTGFFINYEGKTYVVTNLHVVDDAVQGGIATIRFSDAVNPRGDHYNASVLMFDPINDLALLDVHFPIPSNVKPLELADMSTLRNGQDVLAVGNPRTMRFNAIKGSIAQTNYTDESIQMSRVLCNLSATNGNSGGPVVRVKDGKVIGVATEIFIPEYMQSHTICESADAIRQLVFMYKKLSSN